MRFTTLFKETLDYWPSTVLISDGHLIDDKGASFPSLNSAWENAEAAAECQSEWLQLMVWAVYGGLHRQARNALECDASSIEVEKVNLAYVEKKFSENLFTETEPRYPIEMRAAYENDLQT